MSTLNIEFEPSNGSNRSSKTADDSGDVRFRRLNRVFAISVILIAASSLYDALLVFQFRETINEQNPFCAWLIRLEPEYVSLFLLSKVLGTLLVVSILVGLFKVWRRGAIPVALSLVLFQAGLMSYLHGTDGRQVSVSQLGMAALLAESSNLSRTGNGAEVNRKGGGATDREQGNTAKARRLAGRNIKPGPSFKFKTPRSTRRGRKLAHQGPAISSPTIGGAARGLDHTPTQSVLV